MKKKNLHTDLPAPVIETGPVIHVVFQEADVEVLKKAMELDAALIGEVVQIRDEFAVGPLLHIDTEEGWNKRENWWRHLLQDSPYTTEIVGSFDDRKTVAALKNKLDEESTTVLWIWMGQNGHDVCGYYWLISQLKEYAGRINVLYLNNLPFINERGQLFYPSSLHQILPKEFLKAKKLARAVTLSEFEIDPDEWNRLCLENAFVRILEGGKKIVSQEASFYDRDILNNLSADWTKGSKAMHTILAKMRLKTGDVFLLWRMKELAAQEKLEITGDSSKGWKDFEVRLKTGAEAEISI